MTDKLYKKFRDKENDKWIVHILKSNWFFFFLNLLGIKCKKRIVFTSKDAARKYVNSCLSINSNNRNSYLLQKVGN